METSIAETTSAINKSSNWKAPGIDGIANFWIKHLTALHEDRTNAYNICIENPEEQVPKLTNNWHHLPPSKNRGHVKPHKLQAHHLSSNNVQDLNINLVN